MHRIDFKKHSSLNSASPESLRDALRQFASGVTIVTAEHDGERYGITVSAFTAVSLEPPVIMVAINTASALADLILNAEHFAVHILSADQLELSTRFADTISGPEKYAGLAVKAGESGAPVVPGSLAILDCALDQTLLVGTHMLMFGRVVLVDAVEEQGNPLIYYHRHYRGLAEDW
ncbi:MAG TPA: flavin reductase family protein [Candidatus Kapabacteria bacterium]|nr:flavin reductase family protein [Candidatus Kapabacteria bacterium]